MDLELDAKARIIKELALLDPGQIYELVLLTGGVVNFTARATKSGNGSWNSGYFSGHKSLIIKYAPPFVAWLGEKAVMSQGRQANEAHALSLFKQGSGPLHDICAQSSVHVPEFLFQNRRSHILIMSDLGAYNDFSGTLNFLGGYKSNNFPARLDAVPPTRRPRRYYEVIGARVGTFLANLHARDSYVASSRFFQEHSSTLPIDWMTSIGHDFGIVPIKHNLALFPNLLSPEEVEFLYEIVVDNSRDTIPDEEMSLVSGDCWPGGILVDEQDSENPFVGIVDWEFSHFARGVSNDTCRLLSHFTQFQMTAEWNQEDDLASKLSSLSRSLLTTYRTVSLSNDKGLFWVHDEEDHQERDSGGKLQEILSPVSIARARTIRSALIEYASESINNAFWKAWRCDSKKCAEAADKPHPSDQSKCKLIEAMMDKAIWHLRHARENLKSFLQAGNYEVLARESDIRHLFFTDAS